MDITPQPILEVPFSDLIGEQTDWSTVGGIKKPEDDATKGADWDTNIKNKPTFLQQIFYQTTAPSSGMVSNDIWIDSDDNKIYRYDGANWVEIQDSDIAAALSAAATAQATADGKIKVFVQDTPPTAESTGDIWIDSDDNNKPYVWSGTVWNEVPYDVATWSKITGLGKPQDNATLGATIGTDLKDSDANTPGQDLITNYKTFAAGENLVANNVGCIKPSHTDFLPSGDSYTDSGATGDNHGTDDKMYLGYESGGSRYYYAFIKFAMDSVPSAENILKAELILIKSSFTGAARNIKIKRVSSADWAEGTINNTNKPSSTDDIGGVYGGEISQLVGSGSTAITYDVTQIVRQWKEAAVNDYGFEIYPENYVAGEVMSFYTKEAVVSSNRPILRIYYANTSDGKIYKASNDSYLLCRSIIGFILDTVNMNDSCRVQYQSIMSGLSIGSGSTGGKLFLDTNGGYNAATNNIARMIQIGKVFSNTQCCIEIEDRDVEIESNYTELTATTSARRFYAPLDARYALIHIKRPGDPPGLFHLIKSFRCGFSNSFTEREMANNTEYGIILAWGANYIDITPNSNTFAIDKVAFYT